MYNMLKIPAYNKVAFCYCSNCYMQRILSRFWRNQPTTLYPLAHPAALSHEVFFDHVVFALAQGSIVGERLDFAAQYFQAFFVLIVSNFQEVLQRV